MVSLTVGYNCLKISAKWLLQLRFVIVGIDVQYSLSLPGLPLGPAKTSSLDAVVDWRSCCPM